MSTFKLPQSAEETATWGDIFVPELMADPNNDDTAQPRLASDVGTPYQLLSGFVRFLNLLDSELGTFWCIPETGNEGFHPINGHVYNVDGFWHRPIPTHWYKIPDFALVWVYKEASGALNLSVRSSIPGGTPEWRSVALDRPTVLYPW